MDELLCGIALLTILGLMWFVFSFHSAPPPVIPPTLAQQLNERDFLQTVDNPIAIQAMGRQWMENYKNQMGETCHRYLPSFRAENWNASQREREFNNCYAYAFRDMNLNRQSKPQPGNIANIPEIPADRYTCANVFANTKADHPNIIPWEDEPPCPCGYYKAFLVLDNAGPKTDFHYLRQDNLGFWSQKLGSGNATRLDASRQFITNPRRADLNYGAYNYSTRCGCFCIPAEAHDTDW